MRGVRRDPERAEIRHLLRAAPLAGASVIEIGGGEGRLTRRLARVARTILSVDPNPGAVARARELWPNGLRHVRFTVGSGDALHVGAARFDVAVLSWSL